MWSLHGSERRNGKKSWGRSKWLPFFYSITARKTKERRRRASKMLEGTIEFSGNSLRDVELAIEEAKKLILTGHDRGKNSNDTNHHYFFEVESVPKRLIHIIKQLERDYGADIPLSEIIEYAEGEGYTSDAIDERILIMKGDGILFSPDKDNVRFVR